LIGWDTFLVLDLSLDIINGIRWLDVQCDGLASEGLHKDLHTSSKSQYKMESRFFLDVVIGESSAIFQLLARKNESLLIGRNALLILNLSLDVFNSVGWLNVQGDSLTS